MEDVLLSNSTSDLYESNPGRSEFVSNMPRTERRISSVLDPIAGEYAVSLNNNHVDSFL